jgi:hypothetical protein
MRKEKATTENPIADSRTSTLATRLYLDIKKAIDAVYLALLWQKTYISAA